MNRQDDVMKVFDKRWNANHSDDVKKAKEREKSFINKMFNVKGDNKESNNIITPDRSASSLKTIVNGAVDFQKQNNLRNIKGKF